VQQPVGELRTEARQRVIGIGDSAGVGGSCIRTIFRSHTLPQRRSRFRLKSASTTYSERLGGSQSLGEAG
jgi:hypothetical protein